MSPFTVFCPHSTRLEQLFPDKRVEQCCFTDSGRSQQAICFPKFKNASDSIESRAGFVAERTGFMAGINGFDLLQRIKEEPGLEMVKVIMLSGTDLRIESRISGADEFIIKPFMPDELIQKIEKLME